MDHIVDEVSSLNLSPSEVKIPAELWLRILDCMDTSNIPQLALVSQQLRVIVQSLIFKTCVFQAGKHHRSRHESHLRLNAKLTAKISALISPHIAQFLRKWTLVGGRRNSGAYVAALCATLPMFPNLDTVHFKSVRMTSTLVSLISAVTLKNPLSLSLISCMTDFPGRSDRQPGSIALGSLLMHNDHIPEYPHDHYWLSLLRADMLTVLDLATAHSTASFMFGMAQRTGTHFSNLEILHLHLEGLDNVPEEDLVSILATLHSVRTFHIHPPHSYVHEPGRHGPFLLPAAALPRLSSFLGPAAQARSYCADRASIRHLSLYSPGSGRACVYNELLDPHLVVPPYLASLQLRVAFPVEDIARAVAVAYPVLRGLRIIAPHATPPPDFRRLLTSLEALALPPTLEVLFLALRHRQDSNRWPLNSIPRFEMVQTAVEKLRQRYTALNNICVCFDFGDMGERRNRTRVWRWTRGEACIVMHSFYGSRCIDVPAPRRVKNPLVTEGDRLAAELDAEWLAMIQEFR
ncbi:hypothetical protein C8F04DRAFT_1139608 [Mycena alexandri]|uniref:F-box domain-containing protein n=1 Tax=Mycena alexandri TaxID=1745969 RepID=A0AAD6S5Z4_9AGAR|nr:hypothetical protein C8F04DRAFT_1139608 [Mycena alexandri]